MIGLLWVALVAAAVDEGGDLPLFTRDEPHLQDAVDAVKGGDTDLALAHARAAVAEDDDQRAIVEYDVGQVLVARARAEAAAATTTTPNPSSPPDARGAAAPPQLDDARTGFERAAGLAHKPRLIAEAQLAAGNAALEMGKLDDAISSFRRALIADRTNGRARRNLQRALELKRQQPPPKDDEKDGDQKDSDKKDGEKKDGEKKDGDKKDGDKKDGAQKDGAQKDDDKKDHDKKDGDKKDGDQQKQPEGDQKTSSDQGDQDKGGPAPAKKKPTSKEEAKRVLQGIRSRERPLTPLEMRGVERQRAKEGKDW